MIEVFAPVHEKLAAAVIPTNQADQAGLLHILNQPVVNMKETLPIVGQPTRQQSLIGDGLLGGIYAGPDKNLVTCEDAVFFQTMPGKNSKTKIVIQSDGVSGTPCAITFARLLVNQVGRKLLALAQNNQITRCAIIATIIEAAHEIPRYFEASIYPYDDLLNNPNFNRRAELQQYITEHKSVAAATLNVLVEIDHRLHVVIIGDGIFGLYHPHDGQRHTLGRSFTNYPEQLSADHHGRPIKAPPQLLGEYLECSIDKNYRWIITTDGPLKRMTRKQFHRVMQKKVEAGSSLDLHDDYKDYAMDDCVFVTNAI